MVSQNLYFSLFTQKREKPETISFSKTYLILKFIRYKLIQTGRTLLKNLYEKNACFRTDHFSIHSDDCFCEKSVVYKLRNRAISYSYLKLGVEQFS
jgi:hypothetical protein